MIAMIIDKLSIKKYHRTIKLYLGENRNCNWIEFLNFINNEKYK